MFNSDGKKEERGAAEAQTTNENWSRTSVGVLGDRGSWGLVLVRV